MSGKEAKHLLNANPSLLAEIAAQNGGQGYDKVFHQVVCFGNIGAVEASSGYSWKYSVQ